ncbi:MAG: 16S rRNA (cytosine(967)-C(5))-methyltransferase RsmB [Opitutaceae bacterium]|nr:16S rRNA (cytosine(967)-C(5))-methyltransferase RsmB [Verrucomicrobiales bacterium]
MILQKPREIAARVLLRRAREAVFVEDLLESALASAGLSTVDRGLCQELVYGVVRWQATLRWLVERKTPGRTQKEGLGILLQLGLYQMFWLDRIPNHAAVNETVELGKHLGFGPQAGFLNAILRAYTRESDETRDLLKSLKQSQPALGYSHPEWLVDRWQKTWGHGTTEQLLQWNNSPPPTFARRNSLQATADELTEQWRKEGVEFSPLTRDWISDGVVFELSKCPSIASLESFRRGMFYIQDPSTLLAVEWLDPQPGETVLDTCAAPGGKTTYMAQKMQNCGAIIALDTHQSRLSLLTQNATRLGASCIRAELSEAGHNARPQLFDRILVDAPCSNTGVMRRRVDLRWRLSPEEIDRLSRIQLGILKRVIGQLKPGGTLIYSTCSLEADENASVIQQLLSDHPELTLERERQLLPFQDSVDGAYVARLNRVV